MKSLKNSKTEIIFLRFAEKQEETKYFHFSDAGSSDASIVFLLLMVFGTMIALAPGILGVFGVGAAAAGAGVASWLQVQASDISKLT